METESRRKTYKSDKKKTLQVRRKKEGEREEEMMTDRDNACD